MTMLDRLRSAIEQSMFYVELVSELQIPLEIALSQIEANPEDLAARLRWLVSEGTSSFDCCLEELKFELQQVVLEIEILEKGQSHE
jgi:hypothetical protein